MTKQELIEYTKEELIGIEFTLNNGSLIFTIRDCIKPSDVGITWNESISYYNISTVNSFLNNNTWIIVNKEKENTYEIW